MEQSINSRLLRELQESSCNLQHPDAIKQHYQMDRNL
jgi:hypothetical protein